ncbi:MAG TPA: hypothetical protein VHF26_20030 [Trebonia sp.]|nr:hypothetical protein [Trebonia sp.]
MKTAGSGIPTAAGMCSFAGRRPALSSRGGSPPAAGAAKPTTAFVTQAVESPLASVCDTNDTAIAKVPKRHLAGRAGDGVHRNLRELAASL